MAKVKKFQIERYDSWYDEKIDLDVYFSVETKANAYCEKKTRASERYTYTYKKVAQNDNT